MKAIMYHYVRLPNPSLPYFRHLRLDAFEKQLDYFEKECRFLTKEMFEESILFGSPNKGIILTFDDGFKEHYRYVLPCLEKRGLWGIFYVATAPYVRRKLIDVHRIHMLLGKYGGKKIFESLQERISEDMLSHAHVDEFRNETYKTQNNDTFTNHVKRILNYYIDYKYREQVMDDLMLSYFPEESEIVDDFYMTRDELVEMHNAGMVVGSHTVNHPVMSKLPVEKQKSEIKRSFKFLEETIGSLELKTFCYPYGGSHTFVDETERLLEQNGCLFSFNVEARDIDQSDLLNWPQALPRYDCNQFPYGVC